MKNLIYKELKLSINPLFYLVTLLGSLILIPNWVYFIAHLVSVIHCGPQYLHHQQSAERYRFFHAATCSQKRRCRRTYYFYRRARSLTVSGGGSILLAQPYFLSQREFSVKPERRFYRFWFYDVWHIQPGVLPHVLQNRH